jgi:hypothetical protein
VAQLLRTGHISAGGGDHCADRQRERVAGVPGRAGQLQGRFVGQRQRIGVPDLRRRKADQDRKRGGNVASADRPRPRGEQVVLLGAEPHDSEHLGLGVVGVVADPPEEVGVVAGVAGMPLLASPAASRRSSPYWRMVSSRR